MNSVEHGRRMIDQLRKEKDLPRTPVSRSAVELVKWTQEHKTDDVLMNGFGGDRVNPWNPKSGGLCTLI
ncbi:G-protein gamma-like domain-containing protein [Strongyloides ratti]|uniref:G-protein gamma-like domain-containing protein n=4 Tax=Strongyloides TaxID=6247 RepID=A0A090MYX8_STRRB|nr:G-protein gamma-like domain-containing protein [Strongyloides ratti]CEF67959.1 G-protein gamma-like domain-containing protein [Strongyloides ratti]